MVSRYPKRPKYSNVKTEYGGHKFDSKKEAARYQELLLLEKAGKIARLKLQPRYDIVIQGVPIKIKSDKSPNGRKVQYVADFQYMAIRDDSTKLVIEDVKGMKTPIYKLKKALMEAMGYEVTEI